MAIYKKINELNQQNIFTNNLLHYVELSGKQQKEIAKDISIPIQTFNGWCNGVSIPKMDKIQIIADYFHIPKSSLLEKADKNQLSDEEMQLLEGYRKISEPQKELINKLLNELCK